MYFWIGIVFSIIGFVAWLWYEAKHAPVIDDEEYDEAVKAREVPKLPE